jgi:uncharacterized protein (DUF4415 family)
MSKERMPISLRKGLKTSPKTRERIDADVLDWLRSKGDGHLTRINEILRERMISELQR